VTDFYTGQRVVCVDAKPREAPVPELCEGEIYTVQKLVEPDGLQLKELMVDPPWGGYFRNRFKPTDPTPDISVFERLLVDA
jgi:hypothetical protein